MEPLPKNLADYVAVMTVALRADTPASRSLLRYSHHILETMTELERMELYVRFHGAAERRYAS